MAGRAGRCEPGGFYRFDLHHRPPSDDDVDLQDAIQRIALEWPRYGRLKTTAELRRRGWKVNPKRVCRLMREGNGVAVDRAGCEVVVL